MNFEAIGAEIGRLVAEKNAAYGDSFGRSGDVMRILYPNGIKPEEYDDALAVIRVIDKLFRIATARDAFGESPWRDVAGYGIRAVGRVEERDAALVLEDLSRGGTSLPPPLPAEPPSAAALTLSERP